MEAAGWHYRYEHSATGHKLILSDDSTQALPIDGTSTDVRFHSKSGSRDEDGIESWSPVRHIVPGKTAMSAFDFKSPIPTHASHGKSCS